ncbi:MAG: hypothetical protein AB7L09_02860 [Nitrospira sp.]
MNPDESISSIEDAIGACCGNTNDMVEHIYKTLQIMAKRSNDNRTLNDKDLWAHNTMELTNHLGGDLYAPMATVYLHYLDRLNLTEHGSGIAGSWLTPDGYKLLEALNKRRPLDALMEAVDGP